MQLFLKQGEESIISVISINSFKPKYNIPAYTAAKHAVVGLTKTATPEYGGNEIRFGIIATGAILTKMSAASLNSFGAAHERPFQM